MSYNLIISEKPDASHKIAMALADKNTIIEEKVNKTRYYSFKRGDENYFVVPAVGHLFTLKNTESGKWKYPIFEANWVPSYIATPFNQFTKQYVKNFEKIGKNANKIIVATDWDNEGSVIAYNILRFILKRKNAERMFFTTLTKEELNESFENRKDSVDIGMVFAGLTRHRLDWMYGVNITIALTLALKNYRKKGFHLISTGRVQGPTLKLLVDKEKEIREFVPQDYYKISIIWNNDYEAIYEKQKIFDKNLMEKIVNSCKDEKNGTIKEVNITKQTINPPVPMNLTMLQTLSYKFFKYTPYITQQIAQKLYTKALISYPRTSSQQLPNKINFKKILNKIKEQSQYNKIINELLKKEKLIPTKGKKEDKAHSAIYPTGEVPKSISSQERNVYDLIVRHFFSVFGEQGEKENKKIIIDVNNFNFISKGVTILKKGWMEYYGKYANKNELIFPDFKENNTININKFNNEKKQTEPPARYSQSRLINEMEKRGLGTKATRANIIKTLIDRKYVNSKTMKVSELGIKVIDALTKYSPRIISEELTKNFEKQLNDIIEKRETKEEVIALAEDILIGICNKLKEHELEIGKELNQGLEQTWENNSNVGKIVGKCPKCNNNLIIMYSKKNGQEFIGCEKYPTCNTTYALPKSIYKLTNTNCEICKAPIVLVGKKEYKTCLNKDCSSRFGGVCPKCGNNLRVMYNKRGGRFLGCSNYPKCKQIYPLPSKEFKFINEKCLKCGAPLILINNEKICVNKRECEKNGSTKNK